MNKIHIFASHNTIVKSLIFNFEKMKKKVLKSGVIVAIISTAVWSMSINNNSKLLFTSFFNIDAMAKMESICLSEGDHNTGTCRKLEPADKGSACIKANFFDSKNCFGSEEHDFSN